MGTSKTSEVRLLPEAMLAITRYWRAIYTNVSRQDYIVPIPQPYSNLYRGILLGEGIFTKDNYGCTPCMLDVCNNIYDVVTNKYNKDTFTKMYVDGKSDSEAH